MAVNKTMLVEQHLKTKGEITSWEAIGAYGATRLSAIIHKLRRKGLNIDSEPVVSKDRFGNRVVYSNYKLIQTQ